MWEEKVLSVRRHPHTAPGPNFARMESEILGGGCDSCGHGGINCFWVVPPKCSELRARTRGEPGEIWLWIGTLP